MAPALIARLDWQGRVLTGDALFCQRNLCRQVIEAGGDYLLLVKENQPTLCEDIRLLFDPPLPALPLTDSQEARTVDHGHGRHNDVRHLVGYSDWPGLAQVFRLEQQQAMVRCEADLPLQQPLPHWEGGRIALLSGRDWGGRSTVVRTK